MGYKNRFWAQLTLDDIEDQPEVNIEILAISDEKCEIA